MTTKLKLWTSKGWQPSMVSRTELLAQLKKVLSLNRPQPQLSDDEVPLVFREPHIATGYRVPHQPWTYYLASLFELHNETVNVWSHIVGFFIFLYKVYDFADEMDYVGDPLTWPLLAFSIGTMFYAVLSSLAHLLHSKSETAHYFWFQIDYVGIGMNACGTGTYLYYLAGTKAFYETFGTSFLVINALMGFLTCVSCSISKLCYCRPYPFARKLWMMGPVCFSLLFSATPLFFKTYDAIMGSGDPDGTIRAHYEGIAVFIVASYFFSSGVPEKLSPGTFDVFGHGHSVFHIIMTAASMMQYRAAVLEYHTKSPELRQMVNPTFMTVFGFMILVVLADIAYIYSTRQARLNRVAADTLRSQEEKLKAN